MRIAVIGSGYVGLVSGLCLAETGNHVVCVDKDEERIRGLNLGTLPIYEMGLDDLYHHNVESNRIVFTTDLQNAVKCSDLVFIAVGTPPQADGHVDVSAVWVVSDEIASAMDHPCLVIVKSTVPVGTTLKVKERIASLTDQSFDIANNPEFLKEGLAVEDFNKPDRIVIGVENLQTEETLRELYTPFMRGGNPLIVTDICTSELIKYVSNAMLATKISFINEAANLCEIIGANIRDLRRGVCSDKRIGLSFMFPGIGYGGSCFPKDVPALINIGKEHGYRCHVLEAVHTVNSQQPGRMFDKICSFLGGELAGKTVAVWGVAYKAGTDDVRRSPSIIIIEMLLKASVRVQVHDPQAIPTAKKVLGDRVTYYKDAYEALNGADVLLVGTDWREYRTPDFDIIRDRLSHKAVFDGRNIYNPARVRSKGVTYVGIG